MVFFFFLNQFLRVSYFIFIFRENSMAYLRFVNNGNDELGVALPSKCWSAAPPGWAEDSCVIHAAILLQLNKL